LANTYNRKSNDNPSIGNKTHNNRFPKMLPKRRTFGKRNVRGNYGIRKNHYKIIHNGLIIQKNLHKIMQKMTKNILSAIATVLLLASCYFIYDWYNSEPNNKEPLPALLSVIAAIISTFIAWRLEGTPKEEARSEKKENAANVTGNNNIINQSISNNDILIHTGKGDNVQGEKKVYNIGKIDKADFS
jgi:hypothetical protein